MTDDSHRELRDRLEIQDVLNRYASSLDGRDWRRLATCFTPDATADYGTSGTHTGTAAIERLVRRFLEGLDASQHFLSNHEIEISGDTARTRCYLQAQHVKHKTPGGDHYLVAGTYEDKLERTDEGWRIRERRLRVTWVEGNPAVLAV